MTESKVQPSDDLIDQVRFIADIGASLPRRFRTSLGSQGVHCRVRELRDGNLFYLVFGKLIFIPKLTFTLQRDGTVVFHKYKPGDWEAALDASVAKAYEIADQATPTQQEMIRRRVQEGSEQRRQGISYYEERTQKEPHEPSAWVLLAPLYDQEGRFKDMEKALKRSLELMSTRFTRQDREWAAWLDYKQLGKAYLAALSNSKRGKGIPIWGYIPSHVTPESLGYTIEEVCNLAQENLGKAYELQKRAGFGKKEIKKVELAYKAAVESSDKAFEKYITFKPEQEAKESKEYLRLPEAGPENDEDV